MSITFDPEDAKGLVFPHQDPLVVSATIADFEVKRILVDGGSTANTLFVEAFDKMIPQSRLLPLGIPLIGFRGKPVATLGQIGLSVMFGEGPSARTESITFDVVDIPYQYNAIPGHATLNVFNTLAHHNYIYMKLPGQRGIITVWGDQDLARHTKLKAMAHVQHVHTVEQNPTKLA